MVELYLHDCIQMEDSVKGLKAELYDSTFPLLSSVIVTSNINIAFRDADYVFLVGARSREPIFKERKDLLLENC